MKTRKNKKGTGNIKTTVPRDRGEDEAPRIDLTARQGKEPSEAKKPGLTFKVNLATDSDCIWEGEVVGDGEVDGKYSVEDSLEDTILYDLDEAPTSPKSLYEEGYVPMPVEVFRPNPAFDSVQNLSSNRKTPTPSDSYNWRKPGSTPKCTTVVDADNSDESYKEMDDDNPMDTATCAQETAATTASRAGSPITVQPMAMRSPKVEGTGHENSDDDRKPSYGVTEYDKTMADTDAAEVKAAMEEFIKDPVRVREAMKEQLVAMAYAQRVVLRQVAHAQATRVFERLRFVNIDKESNEYIRQYNNEMLMALLGRDIRLTEEAVRRDRAALGYQKPMVLSFEEQRVKIEEQLAKGKLPMTETPVDEDQPSLIPIREQKKRNPRAANPKPTEEEGEGTATSMKEQPSGCKIPDNIRELQNRVVLQRIHLSQIRDRIEPTVQDQGIVFNNNNNAWVCPDGDQKKENHDKG
ncbi:hypothetical protein EDD85DRAFT_959119 [Armillaria nabsnona]|nr:hypothetical protein EDD85DRAFT_959119 [Armillaria nabsnona]